MTGRLEETDFYSLKEQAESDQSSIVDFVDEDTTYIAVVSLPRHGISEVVDEVWTELGMPDWALERFLARREGYRSNSAIDDAHNAAYDDLDLESIYYSHLKSEEARDRVEEIVDRLLSGENITLVCFEPTGKQCHRHILIDRITDVIEQRESSKFKLSS